MKAYKAFIKPVEAPQRSENKNKLFFYLCPGSEQEGLTTKVKKKKSKGKNPSLVYHCGRNGKREVGYYFETAKYMEISIW